MKRFIYLDHNATTRPRPEVVEAMLPHLKGHFGNASSIYQLGQEERRAVDHAREQLARLIGAGAAEEVVFTGGGSESINWALKGVAFGNRAKGRHLVTTKIEHSAGLKTCHYLETLGWHVTYVGVDWHGRVNASHVKEAITDNRNAPVERYFASASGGAGEWRNELPYSQTVGAGAGGSPLWRMAGCS